MSQQHHRPEYIRAQLEKIERERAAWMEALSRAESFPAPSPAPSLPPAGPAGFHAVPSQPPSLGHDGRSTSATLARANPNKTQQSRPMKRSKTTHGPKPAMSAPMMRSKSTISRPGPHHNPFAYKGPGPLSPVSPLAPPAMMNSLSTPGSGPQGDYLHPNHAQFAINAFAQTAAAIPTPPQYAEMNVEDFISMRDGDTFTAPISIPQVPPHETDQYPSSSFPSVCGSMTSGPTLETAPMSRRGSAMNDGGSISSQFEMVRIQSQQSNVWQPDGSFRASPMAARPPSFLGKRASEDSGVVTGNSFPYFSPSTAPPVLPFANPGASQLQSHPMETSFSQSSMLSTSSAGPSPHELSGPLLAEHLTMERSASKDSIKSNSSLKLRAKATLARQNYAAKARQLQPRPAPGSIRLDLLDPVEISAKEGKAVIAKAKYERPKHPKVVCNQCNEHPEGFRGEHELRRHTQAKHKSMVKKYICRDPARVGLAHSETPAKSLDQCKKCSGEKQYGAYYNAAAHLRRTHFNVRPRKGAAGSKDGLAKADEEKEKRGGKGGGDWPPMNELKLWMVEVTVSMDQDGALGPDGGESVGAVDPEDQEAEAIAEAQYASQTIPLVPAGYDHTSFAGVGGGFDLASASFQGDLDSQLSDFYYGDAVLDVSAALPIASSVGFDHMHAGLGATKLQLGAPLGSYASPVSSTATITPAAAYMDQLLPPGVLQMAAGDLPDLPFELTFATGQEELFEQGN